MAELPESPHSQLAQRAVADPGAFVALYHLYAGRVYGYVAARVDSRSDAEDIVSDVFMRALRNLDQLRTKQVDSFASWLFSIARHAVADYYRRDGRGHPVQPLEDSAEISAPGPSLDQIILESAEAAALYALVRGLPERQREVVTLRYYGGLRNREIADVLGIGEKTVSAYLSRALNDLRAAYEKRAQADARARDE